jgi:hypothetical protein
MKGDFAYPAPGGHLDDCGVSNREAQEAREMEDER